MKHEVKTTFTQVVETPDHADRKTTNLFKKNRKELVAGVGKGCWICGCEEDLECHHIIEWSLFNSQDVNKMKDTLMELDFYGFSKEMKDKPLETPDDIRNLLILCEKHHRGENNGVHALTFPVWVAQKSTKDGVDITPDDVKE